jgi:DNA topoisomerase-3
MTNPGRYVEKEAIKKFYRGDIGIGTQSTRAQIIETLISRKYVHRSGKKLVATDKGVFLVEFLRKCPVSSVLTSPEETARWEMTLNTIALGEGSDTHFLMNIKRFVTDAVSELKQAAFESNRLKPDVQALPVIDTGPACPVCGGKIIEGKKGYGCTNWRMDDGNCRFVIWKDISGKTLTAKNIETLLAGKTTRPYVLKDTNGRKFKARMRLIQNPPSRFALEIMPDNESSATSGFQVSCSR